MPAIAIYCPKCGMRVRRIDYGERIGKEAVQWAEDKRKRDLERRFTCPKCGISFKGKEKWGRV